MDLSGRQPIESPKRCLVSSTKSRKRLEFKKTTRALSQVPENQSQPVNIFDLETKRKIEKIIKGAQSERKETNKSSRGLNLQSKPKGTGKKQEETSNLACTSWAYKSKGNEPKATPLGTWENGSKRVRNNPNQPLPLKKSDGSPPRKRTTVSWFK